MNNERKVCAEFFHTENNCCYAKIVEGNEQYSLVCCAHPIHATEKLIGNVAPYISCYAPSDCPELQKEDKTFTSKRKKLTFWEKVDKFFEK